MSTWKNLHYVPPVQSHPDDLTPAEAEVEVIAEVIAEDPIDPAAVQAQVDSILALDTDGADAGQDLV